MHDFSVAVAVNEHCKFWIPKVAVTTARSVELASLITIVGVASNVTLSLTRSPLSDEEARVAECVSDRAVVSMVIVNC